MLAERTRVAATQELKSVLFGGWTEPAPGTSPGPRQGAAPDWDRLVIVAFAPAAGTSELHYKLRRDNKWSFNRAQVPAAVTAEIEARLAQLAATAESPATLLLIASTAPESAAFVWSTGPSAAISYRQLSSIGHQDAHLDELFGDRQADSELPWIPLHIEHRRLIGTTARISPSSPVEAQQLFGSEGEAVAAPARLVIAEEAPRTDGEIFILPAHPGPEVRPVSIPVPYVEVQGLLEPEREEGDFIQDFVGAWKLLTVRNVVPQDDIEDDAEDFEDQLEAQNARWLLGEDGQEGESREGESREGNGREGESTEGAIPAAAVSVDIVLTIRADGSFFELADGQDGPQYVYDDEGVQAPVGTTFHGYLRTAEDRDFIMSYASPDLVDLPILRVADGDTDITDELILDGDVLRRVQSVVTDGLYRTRTVLEYRSIAPLIAPD